MEIVSCWVSFYMRREGLKPSDMAKLLNVTERTLKSYMDDPGTMTLYTLSVMATRFKVPITALMKEV